MDVNLKKKRQRNELVFCLEVLMSIQKIIKFYTFEPQPSMLTLNNGSITLNNIELLKKVFTAVDSYNFQYEKENYTIDILEIGANFIFGTCSKESDLKYTNFYQMRNTQTNATKPYTSVEPGQQLEVYTYFYIDCSSNRMTAIQHKNISKIHLILSEFICNKSGNMINFYIAPERIPDVRRAAKKLQRTKSLELSFAKGRSKENIESLAKSLGDIEYDSYAVTFKLSQKNDKVIDKLFHLSTTDRDNINGIKLTGKNEYGLDETINFIENVYTRNTPFDLSDDIVTNIEYIKNKLSEALLS